MRQILISFVIAGAGVAVFLALGLPLPWLLGPMFGCLVAALAGVDLRAQPLISNLMRTVLGVAVGASITPALFAVLPQLVPTLLMMPLLVVMIGGIGYPMFRRVFGFNHATAYYSAMPGGLQDMLLFGEDAGGDVRALSLVHATRVLIIVTVLPFAFAYVMELDLTGAPGAPIADVPVLELVIMAAAGILGWRVAKAVGLFGAAILGPLFLTAGLSLADVIHNRPPAVAIQAAQFFIGLTVGVKYSGITWRELRIDVSAGVGFTVVILTLSLLMAEVVILAGFMPPTEAILAFSPGGQAEMAILALVAGADVGIVVGHHLVRLVFVITLAPVVERWLGR